MTASTERKGGIWAGCVDAMARNCRSYLRAVLGTILLPSSIGPMCVFLWCPQFRNLRYLRTLEPPLWGALLLSGLTEHSELSCG